MFSIIFQRLLTLITNLDILKFISTLKKRVNKNVLTFITSYLKAVYVIPLKPQISSPTFYHERRSWQVETEKQKQ